MGRLICELGQLGMTALHRVGLAGLYMTLDACERDPNMLSELDAAGVSWQREDHRITLDFADGKEKQGIECLIGFAYQLDDGFFKLPGLERNSRPSLEQRWLLYQALLGTFLQFGPHRATGKKGPLVVEIDDKQLLIPAFAPVTWYRHQQVATKDLFTPKGSLRDTVALAGWLYPGGAKRHARWGASALDEPAGLAFCLLFAPVGAIFFQVASRRRGRKARTALVLPQVVSLQHYARLRRVMAEHGVLELTAASPTDAALQLALMARAQDLGEVFDGPIRVLAFGIVAWNKNQKSRTAAYSVTPAELSGLHNYELANSIFRNRWQLVEAKRDRRGKIKEPAHHFVRPFTAREIIADNVANRRRWYAGFAEYLTDEATRISLQFERKELFRMTQDADYDHPNERIFIQACHEAWRRRLGQLGERARREHVAFNRLAGGEYDKQRVAFARCKNATTLRAALTDFWSRAGGSLPSLQEGWESLLPLLEEDQWHKARDLALLALASYQSSDADEGTDLSESTATREEGDEE